MNKRNLWLIIGAVVVIVAIVIGMNVRKGSNGTSNEFRIGAIVFLTGPQAALGTEVRNAVSLAQEEVNAKGGINGKMINVLFEDSKDSPRDAIAAFNRLETGSLPVVLSTGDVVSLNLAPIVAEKKIPMVATITTALRFHKRVAGSSGSSFKRLDKRTRLPITPPRISGSNQQPCSRSTTNSVTLLRERSRAPSNGWAVKSPVWKPMTWLTET